MRPKLTYSNVVSTICLFLLLGGGAAYAASHLGKNSVGAKQLKKNSIITAKIKNEAVTAAKVKKGTLTGTQINAATLGTVPTAQTANTLAAPEAWHEVGAPGEPAFYPPDHWHSAANRVFPTVAFYKDLGGVVHLRGLAEGGIGNIIFTLPSGYRAGKQITFAVPCFGEGLCGTISLGRVVIGEDGQLTGPSNAKQFSLDGITFRAES